jgi:hypothetical protein
MGQPYSLLATPYSLLQPCLCLCRALLQTTYTRPLRRTILQCSQIFLTLVRTFMAVLTYVESLRAACTRRLGLKRLSISLYVATVQGAVGHRGGLGFGEWMAIWWFKMRTVDFGLRNEADS